MWKLTVTPKPCTICQRPTIRKPQHKAARKCWECAQATKKPKGRPKATRKEPS